MSGFAAAPDAAELRAQMLACAFKKLSGDFCEHAAKADAAIETLCRRIKELVEQNHALSTKHFMMKRAVLSVFAGVKPWLTAEQQVKLEQDLVDIRGLMCAPSLPPRQVNVAAGDMTAENAGASGVMVGVAAVE